MKVGFYLENSEYSNIDFSHPEKGNPGIRGTQYMIWAVACKINDNYPDIEVFLLAQDIHTMPKNLNAIESQNEYEALERARHLHLDIIVLRTHIEDELFFDTIEKTGIPCVMWTHNFENISRADKISNTNMIKRNVCVGRQQYERLRDHDIFNKSTYIYNALDFENFIPLEQEDKSNTVVYMGALNPMKGFHLLAKSWKEVIKSIPDAKLIVLGKGDLGKSGKLGKYGLALPAYEKKFIKYLVDSNGEIIPSVHFLGNVGGDDKKAILEQAKVGIANPVGRGETFCIVAIEFQALKVPVVAANRYGLLDTVMKNKSGLLIRGKKQLSNAIIELLNNDKVNKEMGDFAYFFVRENFDMECIVESWAELLDDIYHNNPVKVDYEICFPNNQLKWLREANRKLKTIYVFRKLPSVLMYESYLRNIIKRIRR